jgi:hypothetical protein
VWLQSPKFGGADGHIWHRIQYRFVVPNVQQGEYCTMTAT